MILSCIFVILSTLLFYLFWGNKIKFIKNTLLKICFSWFLGYLAITFMVFLLANFLALWTSNVLQKASIIVIILLSLINYYKRNQLSGLFAFSSRIILTKSKIINILVIIFCLILSYFFYKPHLKYDQGKIYTSPVYWDFKLHMPLVQNFVYGDNFPPENESFSGFTQTYHYFYWFGVSIFSSLGLNLVQAINFISILFLFLLLLTIYAVGYEIFSSRAVGFLTIFLIMTTGSLRFTLDFRDDLMKSLSVKDKFIYFFNNQQHPYFFSILKNDPFGYNGNMFNVFFFVVERQLIPAIIFLLFFLILIYRRHDLSKKQCFIYGMFLGFFFQWHLFATVAILPILVLLFLLGNNKSKTLWILSGFTIIFGSYYLYFKNLTTTSGWFLPEIIEYPKKNFEFSTMPETYPFSILNAFKYYFFEYGIRLAFIFAGLILLLKKNKQAFISFVCIIIPIFLLINTVQLSPISVYDNHKWLKPLNIILDLLIAYAFVYFLKIRKNILLNFLILLLFIPLILGGLLELIPYLRSKPVSYYANEDSTLVKSIRNMTPSKSSFITSYQKEVHLAGRKTFTGDYIGGDLRLDIPKRNVIVSNIYYSSNKEKFCQLSKAYQISYVEKINNFPLFSDGSLSYLIVANEKNSPLKFVNVNNSCR